MAEFQHKQNGKGVKRIRNRFGGDRPSEGRRIWVECGTLSHKRHLREAVTSREALKPDALTSACTEAGDTRRPLCNITGEPVPVNGTVSVTNDDGSVVSVVYVNGIRRSAHVRPAPRVSRHTYR